MKHSMLVKFYLMRLQSCFFILAICTTFLLSACANGKNAANPQDPYENYNRKIFAFNKGVDKILFKPIAKMYDTVTPSPVQKSITNFFSNLAQAPTMANDLLQGNMEWFVSDTGRLIVNTILGIGGLFDVATPLGIERHKQDFGLTLAKWGMKDSPYLLLPFLPPSTSRDLFGLGADYFLTVYTYVRPEWISYTAYGVNFTSLRASVLGADKLIEESFDPYIFVRDAYLQRRQSQIEQIFHPDAKRLDEDDLNEEHFSET